MKIFILGQNTIKTFVVFFKNFFDDFMEFFTSFNFIKYLEKKKDLFRSKVLQG